MTSRDVVVRILEKCQVDDRGCLIFGGYLMNAGYGQISNYPVSKHAYTHRVMYARFIGPIPEGYDIDHLCRNRACCNPAHLEAVTRRENAMRGAHWVAEVVRTNRCPRGHEMNDAYVRPGGKRMCRTCKRVRDREYYARQTAERTSS